MAIPIIGDEIPVIGEEPKKRAGKCLEKIQNILEQYDCVIIPVITIAGTKIVAMMDIQPKVRNIPARTPN